MKQLCLRETTSIELWENADYFAFYQGSEIIYLSYEDMKQILAFLKEQKPDWFIELE